MVSYGSENGGRGGQVNADKEVLPCARQGGSKEVIAVVLYERCGYPYFLCTAEGREQVRFEVCNNQRNGAGFVRGWRFGMSEDRITAVLVAGVYSENTLFLVA
jgi:hypothetical protein